MNRSLRLVLVCLAAIGFLAGASQPLAQQVEPASSPDSTRPIEDPFQTLLSEKATQHKAQQRGDIEEFTSLDTLHAWFDRQALDLAKQVYGGDPGGRVVPLGVYSVQGQARTSTSRWNVGVEYHEPLKTWNGLVSVLNSRLGQRSRLALNLFCGAGGTDVSNLDTEISTSLGAAAEVEFESTADWLNPLLGVAYVHASPDSGADGQGQYLYVGDRIYLSKARYVSLDLKGGFAFWRGFDDRDPNDWFAAAGLSMHPVVDTSPAGRPFFAPVEIGVDYNTVKTVGADFLLPIRLWRGVSLAPRFGFGVGLGDDITSALALGLDWRLFGDEPRQAPFINPYIGVQHYWLDYENVDDSGTGIRPYVGGRMLLSETIALDANLGPAFWGDDYPVEEPDDWLAQIGLTASFGRVRRQPTLRGAVLTTSRDWGQAPPSQVASQPLRGDNLQTGAGEVRVYALEQLKPSDEDSCPPPSKGIGDLSDLKFYSVAMDVDIAFTPMNTKAGLISEKRVPDGSVIIAILVNKNRVQVQRLNSSNTFFHFADLDNAQYFGYRWDANHNRQPEYRKLGELGELEGTGGQLYWGFHDDFVKRVEWLDETTLLSFINGNSIQRHILQLMDDHLADHDTLYRNTPTPERLSKLLNTHRIAYVRYDEKQIDEIKAFLPSGNFGVSIMWANDANKNGTFFKPLAQVEWADGKPADLPSDAKVTFDDQDDFVFSNPVKVQDIITDDLSLDGFAECSPVLTSEHREFLEGRVLGRLRAKPGARVRLTGYTDATPLSPACAEAYPGGQVELATARAEAAAAFLRERGIAADRIEVLGRGVKNVGRFRWKADRAVDIEFLGAN